MARSYRFLLGALAVLLLASFVSVNASFSSASASHILVKDEAKALELMKQINEENADFAEIAEQHSTCPSGRKGGSLGTFSPGQMVREFNDVVFGSEYDLNVVHGPIKTQFGYHLILITERS